MPHDLSVNLFSGLALQNPLMLSSSHLTANVRALAQLVNLQPAAVTLKTASGVVGGDGSGYMDRIVIRDQLRERCGYFCDGDKRAEFLDHTHAAELLTSAKTTLPTSRIGFSILAHPDEDYPAILRIAEPSDYLEFNLKYSLRPDARPAPQSFFAGAAQRWSEATRDVSRFLDLVGPTPTLLKLPREVAPLLTSSEWCSFVEALRARNRSGGRIGLIVANSLRQVVAPMFHDGPGRQLLRDAQVNVDRARKELFPELTGGVLVGPLLFLQTYDMIRQITSALGDQHDLPIVASGGALTIRSILDLLSGGASAVQLCTALELNKPPYYLWLRRKLDEVLAKSNVNSFASLLDQLHHQTTYRHSAIKRHAVTLAAEYADSVERTFNTKRQQIHNILAHTITHALTVTPSTPSPTSADSTTRRLGIPLFDSAAAPVSHSGPRPKGLRVWSNVGNITAHALMTHLAHAGNLVRRTSSDLLKEFSAGVDWDIAAISSGTLGTDRQPENDRSPIRLGPLCDDSFVVIANTNVWEDITTLYHFAGPNASSAARALATGRDDMHLEPLDLAAVAYVLETASREVGVLLKEPLCSMYELITDRSFARLRAWPSQVMLVASYAFVKSQGNTLPGLYNELYGVIAEARKDPAELVRVLANFRIEDDLRQFVLATSRQS